MWRMRAVLAILCMAILLWDVSYAAVEECYCIDSDSQSVEHDDASGAYRTLLPMGGDNARMTRLGHSGAVYVLNNCPGEAGGEDALHEALYRSINGGEDWTCMNSRMEGSDAIHSRFGARSSGITQLLLSPWDESRAVALSPGPSYWTIVDEGGDEPWVSPEANPGFQIEFTYLEALFHEFDNEKLLLSSMDEMFYPRWFTSRDFGASTHVMGIDGYALFSCKLGTGDSVVCDCLLQASESAESYMCLTTNFGQTTALLPVEDEEALHAVVGGIWHLDAEHSVLYASSPSGLVFFSVWDGETYPPLQRATLNGMDRLPGSLPALEIADSYSIQEEFVFLSTADLDQGDSGGFYWATILRASASAPGVLTVVARDSQAMNMHWWNTDYFTLYGALSDSKLSNQTVMATAHSTSTEPMSISWDYGRSWGETTSSTTANITGPGLSYNLMSVNAAGQSISSYRPLWEIGGRLFGYMTTGTIIASDSGLFMSEDFGHSWTLIMEGDQQCQQTSISESGSVTLSQNDDVHVSYDLGLSWSSVFEGSVSRYDLLFAISPTEDGDFERFCGYSSTFREVSCIYIPTKRPCQGMLSPGSEESDFEQYAVANGACLGGEQIVAVRKRRDAQCSMIGIDFEEKLASMPCQCTLEDFTCNSPEYEEDGDYCVSTSTGDRSDPDGYIRSPYNVCEGKDTIYIDGSTATLLNSDLVPTSPEDVNGDSGAENSDTGGDEPMAGENPEAWQWLLTVSMGAVLFCFGVSMCVVSGIVLMVRAKRRSDEAKVFGVSSSELQLIDDELGGIDDIGDDHDELEF